jgi:hypothetical protein
MWVDVGRLWSCVSDVDLLRDFLRMVHVPPVIETDESHNVSMSGWSMGIEPVSDKPYNELVKENAAAWRRAWELNFGDNAVIRTTDRWDGMVKHLGYTSHSVAWAVQDTLSKAITTDAELVKASAERLREVEVIPDGKLTSRQLSHLRLARAIADEVTPYIYGRLPSAIHAAIIPPASDRVRTAGMYSRSTEEIYIGLDQLERGSSTVDTVVHELAHHTSGAEDLEEPHSAHMTRIAAQVVQLTHLGRLDEILKGVTW